MKDLTSLSLKVRDNKLFILDQTKLPQQELWCEMDSLENFSSAIKELKVRGAPLIGISASIFLSLQKERPPSLFQTLKSLRPTAVNVMHMLTELSETAESEFESTVERWFEEDKEACRKMADYGRDLINNHEGILTYCNTGGLACAGEGTALAVIKSSKEKDIHVYVPETRPLLQGARLTAWELQRYGMNHTLICDNTVAQVMGEGKIQKVFVGADRISQNGDVANKIGTRALAILAHYHQIPFYVVAPLKSFDEAAKTNKDIPIELRDGSEVRIHPQTPVYNPAFDITPHELISAWITETGVFKTSPLLQN